VHRGGLDYRGRPYDRRFELCALISSFAGA
jgi:hypothetical protein